MITPYGSWKSPITSGLIVSQSIGLGQIALEGEDTYWIEMRPAEGGRYVVVRRTPDGQTADVTPAGFNVRTRVHEYGGGAYLVCDGAVYFSNFEDQRLYCQPVDSSQQSAAAEPGPITPPGDFRFADAVIDRERRQLICVREDHTAAGQEARNTLVRFALAEDGRPQREDGGQRSAVGSQPSPVGAVIVSGHDFYSSPRLSPDGRRLAWLAWNHPNMPWDGSELWLAELSEDGSISRSERVAGGPHESIYQPEWSPHGGLYFVSDRTGWWNLYRLRDGRAEALCEMAAEFGRPQWQFGSSTYAFESASRILCSYTQNGTWRLAALDTETLELQSFEVPYTEIWGLRAAPGRVVFGAGSPSEPPSVVELALSQKPVSPATDAGAVVSIPPPLRFAAGAMVRSASGTFGKTGFSKVLRRSSDVKIDSGYLSIPQVIDFPTEHGLSAHAIYYPPRNQDYRAPAGELPQLLVMSHGGPTAAATTTLDLEIQFWTSRGIGVVDVNYGGSTGYGREYRQRLNGQWGVVDVEDCANAARYLVERGETDGERLAIRGGSAGGYTTLCALTFRDEFKAGASYYGVSDVEALAKDTHKFESRYLDSMIGPYPERRDLYQARSPIHFVDRLSSPVIFFQGLEDKVVPPDQAEQMVAALRVRGVPVAYLPFEGEQHGFRRAENIQRALDAELYFYSRIFEFELAEPVQTVPIENLDA